MLALLLVSTALSVSTIAMLIWLRIRLRSIRSSNQKQAEELQQNDLIVLLTPGQRQVFWSGIWRPITTAERRKAINQLFGNYCLILMGVLPLLSNLSAVVGRDNPLVTSVDTVLNTCVSATAIVAGKFAFVKYADQHDRTAYMLTNELNAYLAGSGEYARLGMDDRFGVFYAAARNVLDSNTTSIVSSVQQVERPSPSSATQVAYSEVFGASEPVGVAVNQAQAPTAAQAVPQQSGAPELATAVGGAVLGQEITQVGSPVATTDWADWQRAELAATAEDEDPITQI